MKEFPGNIFPTATAAGQIDVQDFSGPAVH
jgi:hypothetical protein